MTIDEAIEILKTEQRCVAFKGATNRSDAIKLGIEALKRIQVGRNYPGTYWNVVLPSETKE